MRGFVLGMLIGIILAASAASAAPNEDRGPFIWRKTLEGDFAEIAEAARSALSVANFPVSNVRDYRESFAKRFEQIGGGTLPFANYRIYDFCNVMYAVQQLSTDLRMGIFMPCKLVIYQEVAGGEVTLMTLNPEFMPKILDNPELKPVVQELEKAIRSLFDSIDF